MPNSEDTSDACSKGHEEPKDRGALVDEAKSPTGKGDTTMPGLCKPGIPCSSPPRLVSMTEVLETARDVSNMAIAHEIVINSNFQIQKMESPQNSLERKVKEIVHKAFWDSLQAQLDEKPPQYTQAIKLLQEVKESLLSLLLPGHTRLRIQINEVLDMELIEQQAKHDALDIQRLAGFIVGMMANLCAPVRDMEIKKLKGLTETVSLFREIFRVLDLMKVDMANFTMKALKPHLQQESIQYERSKFQAFLDKQPNGLEHTTAWLKTAIEKTVNSVSPSRGHCPAAVSPIVVLNQGYMNLLTWDQDTNMYPETLLMDRSRLQELQQRVDQLILVASILLVTSNTVGAAICGLPGFVDKLKQVTCALMDGLNCKLEDALLAVCDQIHRELVKSLPVYGYSPLTNEQGVILKGQIRSISQRDNVIRNLIGERIHSYLKGFLNSSSPQNGFRALPGGLAPIQAELKEIGGSFSHILHHNRMVFGPFYSSILAKLLFADGDAGMDSR
ncbi:T-complex protein 11-like protein 1 [Stegostoma tigrinum]|uniref:T-complex protein 11-like protein 1 n=1 Tax=Stegostoma tigrinum TaxID=3053191 RepID=UPI00202B248D|nr:T-complex protein 11-like protein 1 [Stegostoma tigrinum]XP_048408789.1 T-complex protein 11-like protein 1 [Stegostoma tigrinum]XP_048408790.1 T-complex protein 11-like protein 1 [Stegostoma tigrinum]